MSEKFVDSLSRARWLLVCVHGIDCGAVIPLCGENGALHFGRSLPEVNDHHISREHCKFSWDEGSVYVLDTAPTNPTYLLSRLLPKRRLVRRQRILPWGKILIGQSTWQLRPRPISYLLPAAPTGRWFSRLRGVFMWKHGLSALFLILMLGRLAFVLPLHWLVSLLAITALFICYSALRRYARATTEEWDSATLNLHLAHCRHHNSPPRKTSLNARTPMPWLNARSLNLWEDTEGPRHPGYYGPYALGHALYDIAANSRYFGGATIHSAHGVWVCGNGAKVVHLSSQTPCPMCMDSSPSPCAHIAIEESMHDLPQWCDTLIDASRPRVSLVWAQQAYCRSTSTKGDGIPQVVHANSLWDSYRSPHLIGTLTCPLGVDEQRNIVSTDLISHGPHGVIVGTTGSGKSEALITLLCGLARGYSPARLRFILIDYKGGASLAPLETLPHTQCLLTDLMPSKTQRTFLALRHLCEDREKLLRLHGFSSLTQWEEKSPHSAPPRIILACDEFTTFADIHPQLFADMLRWTAQGRALGIHILLATQRPDQALSSSILANIDFRLALRCREKTASQILVGSDQAALLPHVPGRAIIDGRGLLQCAWIADLKATTASLRTRWECENITPLWISDMPCNLSPAQLVPYVKASTDTPSLAKEGRQNTHGACPIGLLDGLRWGKHLPLYWSGGHIRFEGTSTEKQVVANAAYCCASAIATHLGHRLVALGETSSNIVKIIDVLAHISELGKVVITIPDVNECTANLESAMGQLHAASLWKYFIHLCTTHNIPLICGTTAATTQWDKEARDFSYRLLTSRPAHLLSQWGLSTPAPTDGHPGRFLVASAPSHNLHAFNGEAPALPLLFQPLTESSSLAQDTESLMLPLPWQSAPTHRSTQSRQCVLVAANDMPAIMTQWKVTRRIAPQQWTELSRINPDELLIVEMTEEIRRVSQAFSPQSDWLLKLRFLPPGNGIYISQGKAHCFSYDYPS